MTDHDGPWHSAEGWDRLTPSQKRELRALHLEHGCTVSWPLAGLKVPEMLIGPLLSSLRMHPNQWFGLMVDELPSFRMSMPGADVDGLTFPAGRRMAFICMIVEDAPAYLSKVPSHCPERFPVMDYTSFRDTRN